MPDKDDKVYLDKIFDPNSTLSDKFDAVKLLEGSESLEKVLLECNIAEIRSYALSKVDNQDVIREVVLNDINSTIRKLALDKLDIMHIDAFRQVIEHDPEPIIREQAVMEIPEYYQDLFVQICIEEPDSRVRRRAVSKLNMKKLEPDKLLQLALNAHDPHVRTGGAYSIEKMEHFKQIALQGDDLAVIEHAIENIDDQDILKEIAKHSEFATAKIEAIEKIEDLDFIREIYHSDPNPHVGKVCKRRLEL